MPLGCTRRRQSFERLWIYFLLKFRGFGRSDCEYERAISDEQGDFRTIRVQERRQR